MKEFHLSRLCLVSFLLIAFSACKTDYQEPEISLEAYQIEEGFELEVIASEPFLEAPVAIDLTTGAASGQWKCAVICKPSPGKARVCPMGSFLYWKTWMAMG